MNEIKKHQTSSFLIRHASLRQIQVFECVARNLSFTRAAEELYLTQPTVSAQVKSLAEAVNMPLYEQIGRNIFLTEVGEQVAASCREVIDHFANLEMKLDDYRGMKRGRLRVSVMSTAKYFMPLALGDFCKQHPNIELGLTISNRYTLLKRIDKNLDDIYILGQIPKSSHDLEVVPFLPNPLVMIAHRDHELASKKNITLKRLSKEPFIMREEGSGIRSAVQKAFKEKNLTVNERLTMQTNEAIKQCVIGDLGVACVSKHTLAHDSSESPVVELEVEGFPIEKHWNIVYPTGKDLSLLAKEFLDFLQENGTNYIRL